MRCFALIATVALCLTAFACAPEVAAGCSSDSDCAVRCERDERNFPGGLCTMTCNKNEDCPMGTLCIDKEDGLCMLECSSMEQCEDFGARYICKDKEDVHGSRQLVCYGD